MQVIMLMMMWKLLTIIQLVQHFDIYLLSRCKFTGGDANHTHTTAKATKPNRRTLPCPLCGKPALKKLQQHLTQVHKIPTENKMEHDKLVIEARKVCNCYFNCV